ncbi:ArsR/SmtB family transcription factor [Prauserella flavalba]|uniref:ArsR family transcriptional regulator n=1 Tax=Prauserella flavalba TaxID=1477506 RepID=A0A318LHB9_9PSEU|nr:winged helix-turn-helix domain-containing protein [Prauserella flavalba]PXY28752.1 ArsR family transcriptional regulator [Prauserella flavalba]
MGTRRRKATEAEANALASGIRLRIIRLTYSEALTNKELAQRLGRDPATTLHHVRKLVETGFLEPQRRRKGNRGAQEIPYRSTGLSWALDSAGSDVRLREAMLEAYLAEIAELEAGELQQWRFVAQVPQDQRQEFENRIQELLEDFRSRPVDPDAERMAVYIGMYPSR